MIVRIFRQGLNGYWQWCFASSAKQTSWSTGRPFTYQFAKLSIIPSIKLDDRHHNYDKHLIKWPSFTCCSWDDKDPKNRSVACGHQLRSNTVSYPTHFLITFGECTPSKQKSLAIVQSIDSDLSKIHTFQCVGLFFLMKRQAACKKWWKKQPIWSIPQCAVHFGQKTEIDANISACGKHCMDKLVKVLSLFGNWILNSCYSTHFVHALWPRFWMPVSACICSYCAHCTAISLISLKYHNKFCWPHAKIENYHCSADRFRVRSSSADLSQNYAAARNWWAWINFRTFVKCLHVCMEIRESATHSLLIITRLEQINLHRKLCVIWNCIRIRFQCKLQIPSHLQIPAAEFGRTGAAGRWYGVCVGEMRRWLVCGHIATDRLLWHFPRQLRGAYIMASRNIQLCIYAYNLTTPFAELKRIKRRAAGHGPNQTSIQIIHFTKSRVLVSPIHTITTITNAK